MNSQEGLVSGLIEVTVKGAFKAEHTFKTDQEVLGSLMTKGAKGEGVFKSTGGFVLDFIKPSAWKNQYELKEAGQTIVEIKLPAKIRKKFEIEYDGQLYELSPGGQKNRSWTLRTDQGAEVCEVLPSGGLKRGAKLEIANQIPLRLLVLVYYLVDKRWKEEAAASADL